MLILVSLEELIELRKLRRLHQGIDVSKLNKGEPKRRKRSEDDGSATTTPSGLVKSSRKEEERETGISPKFGLQKRLRKRFGCPEP